MVAALIWLIIGLVLVAAEALSGDFVLLMLGVGGLASAAAAALGAPVLLTAGVFAVVSLGLIAGVRPVIKRKLHAGTTTRTNTEALVGSHAVAVTEVNSHGGRVKIGGEIWSARTIAETDVIESGHSVTVIEISGATAVVLAKP
jgi:membrane protein implicated in regulation of membrane protease activity